jgi:hypothetical protein
MGMLEAIQQLQDISDKLTIPLIDIQTNLGKQGVSNTKLSDSINGYRKLTDTDNAYSKL